MAVVLSGLTTEQLAYQIDSGANPVAWLVWHLTRVQDDHVAAAFGVPQVWSSQGWARRLGLPGGMMDHGYGHTTDEVIKRYVNIDPSAVQIKECLVLQIGQATGGPEAFPGQVSNGFQCRSMASAHASLHIPAATFDKFVLEGARAGNSFGFLNGLVSGKATFDMFTLAATGDFQTGDGKPTSVGVKNSPALWPDPSANFRRRYS